MHFIVESAVTHWPNSVINSRCHLGWSQPLNIFRSWVCGVVCLGLRQDICLSHLELVQNNIVTRPRLFSHPTVTALRSLIPSRRLIVCNPAYLNKLMIFFSPPPRDRWWDASPGVGGECPSRQTCRDLPDLILSGSITRPANERRPPLMHWNILLQVSFSSHSNRRDVPRTLLQKSNKILLEKKPLNWKKIHLKHKIFSSGNTWCKHTMPHTSLKLFPVLLLCTCNLSRCVWAEPQLTQQAIIVLQRTQNETSKKKEVVMVVVMKCVFGEE